jgi:hypothetical protein
MLHIKRNISEQTHGQRTKNFLEGLDETCVVPERDFVELVMEQGIFQLRVFCAKQREADHVRSRVE